MEQHCLNGYVSWTIGEDLTTGRGKWKGLCNIRYPAQGVGMRTVRKLLLPIHNKIMSRTELCGICPSKYHFAGFDVPCACACACARACARACVRVCVCVRACVCNISTSNCSRTRYDTPPPLSDIRKTFYCTNRHMFALCLLALTTAYKTTTMQ